MDLEKVLEKELKDSGYAKALSRLDSFPGVTWVCSSNAFMGARSFAPNHYYYHAQSGMVIVVTYSGWDIIPVQEAPKYVQELIQELLQEQS